MDNFVAYPVKMRLIWVQPASVFLLKWNCALCNPMKRGASLVQESEASLVETPRVAMLFPFLMCSMWRPK